MLFEHFTRLGSHNLAFDADWTGIAYTIAVRKYDYSNNSDNPLTTRRTDGSTKNTERISDNYSITYVTFSRKTSKFKNIQPPMNIMTLSRRLTS